MKRLKELRSWNQFIQWIKENLKDEEQFERLDWLAEFDKTLNLNEAIELVLSNYPSLWKEEVLQCHYNKPKYIVFMRFLIEKMVRGEVKVSYRKTPKYGLYYVINSRFKPKGELIIEFYKTDKIDPNKLTDEEAQLAGIDSAEEIRALFKKWYGDPLPMMFRNWFRVKEILE
ncbi:MAG: hypothetical protein QXX95_02915 [Nitrososphaerales archaeon]